jgi:hypothetical protein
MQMTRRMRMKRESETQDERESVLNNDPVCVFKNESLNDVCADTDTDMHTHRLDRREFSLECGLDDPDQIRHTE